MDWGPATKRINSELAHLQSAGLTAIHWPVQVSPKNSGVNAAAFGAGACTLLIVINNPSHMPQTVTLRLTSVPDQKTKGRFGDEAAVVKDGSIEQNLSSVSVRVFLLSLSS